MIVTKLQAYLILHICHILRCRVPTFNMFLLFYSFTVQHQAVIVNNICISISKYKIQQKTKIGLPFSSWPLKRNLPKRLYWYWRQISNLLDTKLSYISHTSWTNCSIQQKTSWLILVHVTIYCFLDHKSLAKSMPACYRPKWTYFNENLFEIPKFPSTDIYIYIYLKMSCAKYHPFWPGLNLSKVFLLVIHTCVADTVDSHDSGRTPSLNWWGTRWIIGWRGIVGGNPRNEE